MPVVMAIYDAKENYLKEAIKYIGRISFSCLLFCYVLLTDGYFINERNLPLVNQQTNKITAFSVKRADESIREKKVPETILFFRLVGRRAVFMTECNPALG